ncbi:Acyltransferase family [Legionella donaldsonii]|uniref:Acyltransferase family n=1 Tax=Legionella donaldsonii TaxID=45060 RepID=A0A378JAS9_9GAMM|nr:acyltransferase [Legionella donaldsonii]STX44954.1 Acyltransferase family [Legionella donaldsonii]
MDYQFLNNTNLYTYNSTEHVQELVANWPLYTNPLNHFYFFMAGILLFIVYERYRTQLRQKQQLLVKMILILLVIYMVLDKIVGNPSYGFGRFCYSLLTLAIISLTPFIEIKSTWLRKKLIMLGDISYSVYLIQFPVYTCVIYLTRKFTLFNKTETFFIALLSLLSISYFIYKWYEVPSKNWLTNLAFSPRKNSLELSETT